MKLTRRNLLIRTGALSAGLILTGTTKTSSAQETDDGQEIEVTAIEDLMREHGILRRILIVYNESAKRLRQPSPPEINPPINQAAQLFRSFGENYHEKALEEAFIFPALRNSEGEAASYPEILIAQHSRGRLITDYILAATKTNELPYPQRLADALVDFSRMYQAHAAREDTIVFPAWKKSLSQNQFDDMSEKFEDIEHEQFGEGGFQNALSQVANIENQLQLADLAIFTAPQPPV